MKRLTWISSLLTLGILLVFAGSAFAEDVVYLKDGSIIHGTITEEVPGVSLKIQTQDGNLFVYKVKAIEKITHSVPAEQPAADTSAASPAPPASTPEPDNPNAHFSKGVFYITLGGWNTGTVNQINDGINNPSYEYFPAMGQFGIGLGWLTNGLGFKWSVTGSYQPNDYGSDTTYIGVYGTELELDIAADSIKSSQDVTSFYLPLIIGVWDVDWNVDGFDYMNTTTDFGTGIGFRGFDKSSFYWDGQLLYRWSQRGNGLEYNSEPGTETYVNGKLLDANVSGFGADFSIGLVF